MSIDPISGTCIRCGEVPFTGCRCHDAAARPPAGHIMLPDGRNVRISGLGMEILQKMADGDLWARWIPPLMATQKAFARPPAGHIMESDGTIRKVIGTLPLTTDGAVVGNGAYLWNFLPGAKGRDDDRPMRVCYRVMPIMDPDEYTSGPMRMWSTREAAEAARAAKEEA